ncbi:MAG: YggS family pyridoxal phosphate-dependent enzyme [Vulcanibacillus sp.]
MEKQGEWSLGLHLGRVNKSLSLEENRKIVNEKIYEACLRSNRNPKDIKIIAVTKYVDIDKTKEALNIGYEHIGENRVHNGIEKYQQLQGFGIWHLIGQLQTKKVKDAIGKFEYVHSLDRLALAEEINKRALEKKCVVNCFIQVNISQEETKSGIASSDLIELARKLTTYNNINIVGLMTMAPYIEDKELIRPIFRTLRELRDQINFMNLFNYPVNELSMGMSNDFEVAIEEGATFIRLGSILFNNIQN